MLRLTVLPFCATNLHPSFSITSIRSLKFTPVRQCTLHADPSFLKLRRLLRRWSHDRTKSLRDFLFCRDKRDREISDFATSVNRLERPVARRHQATFVSHRRRFTRIESELDQIKGLLLQHDRILKDLPVFPSGFLRSALVTSERRSRNSSSNTSCILSLRQIPASRNQSWIARRCQGCADVKYSP
jgi:hypothetical protein